MQCLGIPASRSAKPGAQRHASARSCSIAACKAETSRGGTSTPVTRRRPHREAPYGRRDRTAVRHRLPRHHAVALAAGGDADHSRALVVRVELGTRGEADRPRARVATGAGADDHARGNPRSLRGTRGCPSPATGGRRRAMRWVVLRPPRRDCDAARDHADVARAERPGRVGKRRRGAIIEARAAARSGGRAAARDGRARRRSPRAGRRTACRSRAPIAATGARARGRRPRREPPAARPANERAAGKAASRSASQGRRAGCRPCRRRRRCRNGEVARRDHGHPHALPREGA